MKKYFIIYGILANLIFLILSLFAIIEYYESSSFVLSNKGVMIIFRTLAFLVSSFVGFILFLTIRRRHKSEVEINYTEEAILDAEVHTLNKATIKKNKPLYYSALLAGTIQIILGINITTTPMYKLTIIDKNFMELLFLGILLFAIIGSGINILYFSIKK